MALACRWYIRAFLVHVLEYLSSFATCSFKEATLTYTEHKPFSIGFVPHIPWHLNEMLASSPFFSFLYVHPSPVLNDFMQWSLLSVLVKCWMW